MADVIQKEHKQKAGVRCSKKSALRVDLTPMVDLGFLLISFFVFTTTIAQPKAMKLVMPDDSETTEPSKAPAAKTLNLLLGANNIFYTYGGDNLNTLKNVGNDSKTIRAAIIKKKEEIQYKYGSSSGMIVLIKPTQNATYSDVVKALDEMLICDIKTYMLVDANAEEIAALH